MNAGMKIGRLEIAIVALASALAVQVAHAAPGGVPGPTSFATIRSLDRATVTNWSGQGDVAVGTNLCISSSSGAYRLTLTMPALFRDLPANARISFRLIDATGVTQVHQLSGGSTVEFVGSTIGRARSDCENGKYAQLQALIPQDVLTAQQAGDYMSEITMSVSPA